MRQLVVVFLLLLIGQLWSNDAYVTIAGGNVLPIAGTRSSHVTMASETIDIVLLDDSYRVNVGFEFFNEGETETLTVGFPQWRGRQETKSDFAEFAASLNGETTQFRTIEPTQPDKLSDDVLVTRWYTRQVTFPSTSFTKTSISYRAPYGVYGISESVDYLFGTGATWNSSIGKITLNITNRSSKWINEVQIDGFKELSIETSGDTSRIVLESVTPNTSDQISLVVDQLPSPLVTMRRINPEKQWFYRERTLEPEMLALATKQQLRILRNLIFAGRGHTFESSDINLWLQKNCSDWYRATGKVTIDQLTSKELQNLEAVQNEERKRI